VKSKANIPYVRVFFEILSTGKEATFLISQRNWHESGFSYGKATYGRFKLDENALLTYL